MRSKNASKTDISHLAWLAFFMLLLVLTLSSIVIEDATWGYVYFFLVATTLFIFLLSHVKGTKQGAEFILFSPKNGVPFYVQLIAGFSLGFVLTDSILFGTNFLTFLSPLAVPKVTAPLGVLGVEVLSGIFLMSIVVAEIEESFRSSALRPTLVEWMENPKLATVFLMALAVIGYAMFPPLRYFLGLLFLLGIVNAFFGWKMLEPFFKNKLFRHALSIFAVALVFGFLHLKLFSTGMANEQIMVNAFLFAIIADVINWRLKSTVSGKIAHCWNNGVVMCAASGAPVVYGVLMAVIYAGILWVMQK